MSAPANDLRERVAAFGGARYYRREYDNRSMRSNYTETRRDGVWLMTAGLRVRLCKGFAATLTYSQTDSSSNLDGFYSYEQQSVMLALSYEGP